MINHLENIAPGTAPGVLSVRIVTGTDELLDAHELTMDSAEAYRQADAELALLWLQFNPCSWVHIYVYDGDSGECLKTVAVLGERVNA